MSSATVLAIPNLRMKPHTTPTSITQALRQPQERATAVISMATVCFIQPHLNTLLRLAAPACYAAQANAVGQKPLGAGEAAVAVGTRSSLPGKPTAGVPTAPPPTLPLWRIPTPEWLRMTRTDCPAS